MVKDKVNKLSKQIVKNKLERQIENELKDSIWKITRDQTKMTKTAEY